MNLGRQRHGDVLLPWLDLAFIAGCVLCIVKWRSTWYPLPVTSTFVAAAELLYTEYLEKLKDNEATL